MAARSTYVRESLVLSDVVPDLIPQDAPLDAWNVAENVIFKNGETVRVAGDSPTLPGAAENARTCVFIRVSGLGYWVYATTGGIYAHDGGSEYDITPASGWTPAADAVFTSCILSGFAYINASDTGPFYWDGNPTNPCEELPGWPIGGRCIALRAHKNFLFAIGMLSEGGAAGERIRWSDAAEAGTVPGTWEPAADNLAGFLDLAPLSSPCVDGRSLRDSFLIYKQEAIYSLDFIGGNAVFRSRKLFSEHGIAFANALTAGIDDVHIFVGSEGDVFITNGVEVRSLLDGKAQRAFFKDFTQNSEALFACATLAREKLAILAYPKAGSVVCNRALFVDLTTLQLGFRDMPDIYCMAEGQALEDVGLSNAWDGDNQPWDDDDSIWPEEVVGATLDDVIAGGSFGFVLVSDAGAENFVSGPVHSMAVKTGLALGNAQHRKLVTRIWPKVFGREGDTLTFRLGAQDITGGPISLIDPITFTIGQDTHLDCFLEGRFLAVQVASDGGAVWRMGSLDVEYKPTGAF